MAGPDAAAESQLKSSVIPAIRMPDTLDFPAHTMVSEANNDVVFLHDMLEEVHSCSHTCPALVNVIVFVTGRESRCPSQIRKG